MERGAPPRGATAVTWQRRARLLVAAFLVVFSVVVYRAIRPREAPPPETAADVREDPNASTETASGTWTFSQGQTLHFERLLTYPDGRSKAQTVTLTIPDPQAKGVTITAREATQRGVQAGNLGLVDLAGDVDVRTGDGLHVTTATATYDSRAGVVRAPGEVHFERPGLTGSGQGATYDRGRDELWLLDQARIRVVPQAPGDEALDVTAGGAAVTRPAHEIRFERGAHIVRADRVIDARDAVVHLTDDDKRATLVELRGDARVARPEASPATPGDVSLMTSRDMDLTYAEDGRTLRTAVLTGDARVALAGEPGAAGRRIAAARLDIALAPDGTTVTTLDGTGDVSLALPATASAAAAHITAATLQARGAAGSGLRTATFGGGVEYRESARTGGAAADRVAKSARLEVALEPGFGAIDAARFVDHVTFTDGAWRGQGPIAQYDPAKGTLTLTSENAAGPLPRVADDRVTIDARALNLSLDDRHLEAEGTVRSVLQPGRATAQGDAAHLPALLSGDTPVFVASAKLAYDGAKSLATYTGGARLWQGDTLVRGDSITLDQTRGNLSASGAVHTMMAITAEPPTPIGSKAGEKKPGESTGPAKAGPAAPKPGEGASPAKAGPTVADAGALEYDDAARRAIYTKAARLNGPEGDLRAARIELYLAPESGTLSRAEAFDDVTAILEEKYTVTGTHLTYTVADERYVVEGTPVRAIEKRLTECLETVGTILTFLRSTDTINVDGTDGNRSRTRPVPCPGRHP